MNKRNFLIFAILIVSGILIYIVDTMSIIEEKDEIIKHQNAAIAEAMKIMKDLVIEIETKDIVIDILEKGCLEEVEYR